MSIARITLVALVPVSQATPVGSEDAARYAAEDPGGAGGVYAALEQLLRSLAESYEGAQVHQPMILPIPGDASEAVEALRRMVVRGGD